MEAFTFEWEKDGRDEALGLTRQKLLKIADSANELYKIAYIEKSGKKRAIEIPEENLKMAQRLLLYYYLPNKDVHPSTYSYIPATSLLDHVERHRNYRFTLKIDLQDFFGSIPDRIVYQYFATKHPAKLAAILTKIACRNGRLPVGAPSSPMLSNILLHEMDRYWNIAIGGDSVYSRYADDIYFSSNDRGLLLGLLPKFEEYLNNFYPFLKINKQKTRLLYGNNRKITGLVVNDGDITIGRRRKRQLRALLDSYCKGLLDEDQVASLRGKLLPWIEKSSNIAIATGFPSNIVVLDIDVRKGGYDSYHKLQNFIEPGMLNTLQCKTGSGGMHVYFLYPKVALKNKIGILPGIDFKTDGGYVIAPPSNHASGDLYEWLDSSMLQHDCIKPLPESLLEVLKASD
jgi:hypothetical protein